MAVTPIAASPCGVVARLTPGHQQCGLVWNNQLTVGAFCKESRSWNVRKVWHQLIISWHCSGTVPVGLVHILRQRREENLLEFIICSCAPGHPWENVTSQVLTFLQNLAQGVKLVPNITDQSSNPQEKKWIPPYRAPSRSQNCKSPTDPSRTGLGGRKTGPSLNLVCESVHEISLLRGSLGISVNMSMSSPIDVATLPRI
jgi:hypothetical protein